MAGPQFKTEFEPRHGETVPIVDGLARITCNNPSPFTFHGTNTYLLGHDRVAVIDPGPDDDAHFRAIMDGLDGRPVSHIIVTHTHADHSPLAARLKAETGAQTFAEGGHRPARPLNLGETNPLDASADTDFTPDTVLKHGNVIDGDGWSLTALFTPGHTANHMAFAWNDTDYLFSGDHVMAWATSIVAPPDGSMTEYMASLETLLAWPQQVYFPGHGGKLEQAHSFVRALRTHRRMRETAVLDQVKKGRSTIPDMVKVIYRTTDPRLHGAAGLSVMAHLEDLVSQGKVECEGAPSLESQYFPG